MIRTDPDLHAPHLIDVEFLHALRRLHARGKLNSTEANQLLESMRDLRIERYAHTPLVTRVWAWRDNLTDDDATFVALAETLGAPLLTADAKLAAAPNQNAHIHHVQKLS